MYKFLILRSCSEFCQRPFLSGGVQPLPMPTFPTTILTLSCPPFVRIALLVVEKLLESLSSLPLIPDRLLLVLLH